MIVSFNSTVYDIIYIYIYKIKNINTNNNTYNNSYKKWVESLMLYYKKLFNLNIKLIFY